MWPRHHHAITLHSYSLVHVLNKIILYSYTMYNDWCMYGYIISMCP